MTINFVTKTWRLVVLASVVLFGLTGQSYAQTAPAAEMAAAAPAADMGYLIAENWEQHKDKMVGDGYGPDLVKNAIPTLMGRSTKEWRAGAALTPELVTSVPAGTAIASFAENGEYTNTPGQSQAALFVAPYTKDGKVIGFTMLDQWPKQGMAKTRILYFNKSVKGTNGAYSYSTIHMVQ